jgi:hypothetical protein
VFSPTSNKIECKKDVKPLGETIDYKLKLDKHVSVKMFFQQLHVLKCIEKHINAQGRLNKYYSIMTPSFH